MLKQPSEMPRLLFVYGTLQSTATSILGTAQRTRLKREGRVLGPAIVTAKLLDLGEYPGLVEPGAWSPVARPDRSLVHGELLELTNPERTFEWLDLYEGISPACGAACDYRREVMEAVLAASPLRRLTANVYVYQGRLAGTKPIGEGRWPPGAAV